MRFAEVFLRLGVTLVAWMVVFGYLLWLAVLPRTSCVEGETSLWFVLLGATPLVAICILLLTASRRLPTVHELLRYGAIPAVLLSLLALRTVYGALLGSTFGSEPLCGISDTSWQTLWAPVHVLVISAILIQCYRGFRTVKAR